MVFLRYGVLSCLLLLSFTAQSQYNPRCDCSWQGGDKRDYGACDATIDITPVKRTDLSGVIDYRIDAKVNTQQCSTVSYQVFPNEGQEAFDGNFSHPGQILVVDGSHSDVLSGVKYPTMPDLQIKQCTVCKDTNYIQEDKVDEVNDSGTLVGAWCNGTHKVELTIELLNNWGYSSCNSNLTKCTKVIQESRKASGGGIYMYIAHYYIREGDLMFKKQVTRKTEFGQLYSDDNSPMYRRCE